MLGHTSLRAGGSTHYTSWGLQARNPMSHRVKSAAEGFMAHFSVPFFFYDHYRQRFSGYVQCCSLNSKRLISHSGTWTRSRGLRCRNNTSSEKQLLPVTLVPTLFPPPTLCYSKISHCQVICTATTALNCWGWYSRRRACYLLAHGYGPAVIIISNYLGKRSNIIMLVR